MAKSYNDWEVCPLDPEKTFEGDNLCSITLDLIKPTDDYSQCRACNKYFKGIHIVQWVNENGNCPHCRATWAKKDRIVYMNPSPKIPVLLIGVNGCHGSGRENFAVLLRNHLRREHNIETVIMGLRDQALFNIAMQDGSPFILNEFKNGLKCSKPRFERELVADGRFSYNEEYYIKHLEPRIWLRLHREPEIKVVIIPDVSMYHELEWIKKHDGLVVRVNLFDKVEVDESFTCPEVRVSDHELDTYDSFDYLLLNILYLKVGFIETIKKKVRDKDEDIEDL